jgi:hypothetical protein
LEERSISLIQSIRASKALIDQSAMLRLGAFGGGSLSYSSVIQENDRAVNETIKRMNENAREVDEIKTGASSSYFKFNPGDLAAPIKTNSDGKYQINIDAEKKYVLVATKDEFAWVLWIGPDKVKKEISFTNQNLSASGCDGCIFNADITPKKLVGL